MERDGGNAVYTLCCDLPRVMHLKGDGEMPQTGPAVSWGDRVATDERPRPVTEERPRSVTEERPRSVTEERPRSVTEERLGESGQSRATGAAPSPSAGRGAGVPGRRTVTIRGQGAERYSGRYADGSRRRPERRHERAGFRPDRAALWAFLLGVMLILVAVASAHAAIL
jgi:hypothetical protein